MGSPSAAYSAEAFGGRPQKSIHTAAPRPDSTIQDSLKVCCAGYYSSSQVCFIERCHYNPRDRSLSSPVFRKIQECGFPRFAPGRLQSGTMWIISCFKASGLHKKTGIAARRIFQGRFVTIKSELPCPAAGGHEENASCREKSILRSYVFHRGFRISQVIFGNTRCILQPGIYDGFL